MKQLVFSILLVLLLGIFTARHLLFMSYVQSQKHQFKQNALDQNTEHCFRIVLPINALYKDVYGMEWKENGRELLMGSVYHEVLSIKTCGENLEILLVEDRYETELMAGFYLKLGNSSTYVQLLSSLDLYFYENRHSITFGISPDQEIQSSETGYPLFPGYGKPAFLPPET